MAVACGASAVPRRYAAAAGAAGQVYVLTDKELAVLVQINLDEGDE